MTELNVDAARKVWGDRWDDDQYHGTEARLVESLHKADARVPVRFAGAAPSDPLILDWFNQVVEDSAFPERHEYWEAGVVVKAGFYPRITGGASALILGPVGVGKTWQAIGLWRNLIRVGLSNTPQVVSYAALFAALRPQPGVNTEEIFSRYADSGLLVLDDLAVGKASEWTEEIIYRLVNHRYENMLPTIFTSNAVPKDIAASVGGRVSSRLTEMCTRVVLKGDDRRLT